MNSKDQPGKLYYTISEVCQMVDLPASVLRYWETEFPGLKPNRNKAGKRLYRTKDIAQVKQIKSLLHDRRFTIKGAKKALKSGEIPEDSASDKAAQEIIDEIKQGLRELLEILES